MGRVRVRITIHMKRVKDFYRTAVAKLLRAFDSGAPSSNDLPPKHTDLLLGHREMVERLNRHQQEHRYAMRGVPDQPFVEAEQWLKELSRIVSHELERQPEGTLHYDQCYDPEDPENERLYGESRPVRIPNSPRKVWLTIGAQRSPRGYRPVRVIDGPLPTHMAIFAALTTLEAETTSEEDLKVVLPLTESSQPQSHPVLLELLRNEGIEKAVDAYVSARLPTKFAYAKSLLRFYRPGFDDLPTEERQALIERTCRLVNEYRSALRKLLAFAEYGTPGKKIAAPPENVGRDVQAAVLAEVEGLSHAKVGEELGIERSENDAVHGGNSRVSKMVKRGRDVLERAWGKEGWRELVLRLRAERDHWMEVPERAFTEPAPHLRVLARVEGNEVLPTEVALPIDWSHLRLDQREYLVRRFRLLQEWALKVESDARRCESLLVGLHKKASSFVEAGLTDFEDFRDDLDQAMEPLSKHLQLIDKCLTNPFLLLTEENDNDE